MKRGLAIMVALVAFMLLLQGGLAGQKAVAAEINILPYWVAGNDGDYWEYSFISPVGTPDFTVKLAKVTSGDFAGKYRSGDWVDIIDAPHIRWSIVDWDAGGLNIYETQSGILIPKVTIGAVQKLDEVVANPVPGDTALWYFQKLGSSLPVFAGTFDDVLVFINLATWFGPTSANADFGLEAIPYGVTHVTWMAAGIGEIQNRDYDQYGNVLFEYQLKVSSVPLPTSVVFLGSGLLGLSAIGRKRKFSS